ncbi:copper amine oxidase N-terminal domain-containing protein [Cohnella algarum]|uniref:copper amine oxidase N-terminal domain-containing protein n=1 Tax=Cohnella algarum TaxID=2044859 RepID=UPI001966F427|nr:copper amine oxidase N-terminal domain-containing protein [Cohnella algarum]MBN2981913.1 copper amine oxidase N-terminal domain-containing protein [Cohnella algarum]
MKRFVGLAVTAMLLFASMGTASAASGQPEIKVLLNGEPLRFNQNPVAMDGRTFVEFRTLFEAFGYEVFYENATKKITAESDSRYIEMTIGADIAFVNGTAVEVNKQLTTLNGRTLVGVKFLADLSGKEVSWESAAKTVVIVDGGPTAEQQQALFGVLDQVLAAEEASDADALMALFHDESEIKDAMDAAIREQFSTAKTKTTIEDRYVGYYTDEEALVVTLEKSVKVSGGFFLDNESEVEYTLRPDASGQWKIYDIYVPYTDYTNLDRLFDQAVTVPDADKAAIEAVLSAQMKAASEGDTEAYVATMHFEDETLKADASAAIEELFASYSTKATVEQQAIVEYNGADRATLAFVMVSEVTMEDLSYTVRSTMLNDAVKVDGKWLLEPYTSELASEEL